VNANASNANDIDIDVSIIIVHWNVPALLDVCLRSVAEDSAWSALRTETLVVDNASSTDAFESVMRAHRWACGLRLSENHGYAAGCNAGVAQARGATLLLLNPDTELQPGALRCLWDTLHIAPHIGLAAPLLLNPDGTLQSHGYRFPGIANVVFDVLPAPARLRESPLNGRTHLGDGRSPVRIDYPLGAAWLVRRAALEQVGPLDETYGMYSEEVDWCQRLRSAGWTALLAPSARVLHYAGQSTRQRSAAMHEALWLSRARYFERWGTVWQRRLLPGLVQRGLAVSSRRADDSQRAANDRIVDAFARLRRNAC
jgi:N-acetylglucosaminyl-diphospho-decaprenol L-rhamnosyltransferase